MNVEKAEGFLVLLCGVTEGISRTFCFDPNNGVS